MPGPVSDSYKGPGDECPYVPSWCYENGPRMCACGHHEGYHGGDDEACKLALKCKCDGMRAAHPTGGTEET